MIKKIKYNAPVTLTFVLLSLIVLALAKATDGTSNKLLFSVYGHSWTDPLGYIRLFGHSLGHTNWAHYSGNVLLMLLLGPMIEERYTSIKLLIMIIITSLITGIFSALIFPNVVLLGASGIVFMFIILSSFASSKSGTIPITLILAIGIYIGGEIIAGTQNMLGIVQDNISQVTHILGGICGVIFGIFNRR